MHRSHTPPPPPRWCTMEAQSPVVLLNINGSPGRRGGGAGRKTRQIAGSDRFYCGADKICLSSRRHTTNEGPIFLWTGLNDAAAAQRCPRLVTFPTFAAVVYFLVFVLRLSSLSLSEVSSTPGTSLIMTSLRFSGDSPRRAAPPYLPPLQTLN